ncbi:hypothetical protein OO010_12630 [Flavobacteriaceae bacterium KMM 6898]|nr:hypothetical protein [Flavobacteriaceae bacterium KMM 6898]
MRYANNGNARIEPTKGARAKCDICDAVLIAHCGQIKVHHWQHENRENCDSFYEPITEWHLQWQNKFPEKWREVKIQKKDKIHRADVYTPQGLTIEVQHSSISSEQIEEREKFYGKLIWIIDAQPFKDNFTIEPLIPMKLKELKDSIFYKYYNIKKKKESYIEVSKGIISDKKILKRNSESNISNYKAKLTKLQGLYANIKINFAEIYIDNCNENYLFDELELKKYIKRNDLEFYNTIKDIYNQIYDFGILDNRIYTQLKPYQSEQYLTKENLARIKEIDDKVLKLKKKLKGFTPKICDYYTLSLNIQINNLTNKMNDEQEKLDFINDFFDPIKEWDNIKNNSEADYLKEKTEILKYKKEEEANIKSNFSAHYYFHWKYKRNSWLKARSPIFFDIGDTFLYRWIEENELKSYSKKSFLKYYRNPKQNLR